MKKFGNDKILRNLNDIENSLSHRKVSMLHYKHEKSMRGMCYLPSGLVRECISTPSTEMNLGYDIGVGDVLIFLATLK